MVFCHTLAWISHGFTCIPHPDPPSHLPLHPIPLGLPSALGQSTCLMHPICLSHAFNLYSCPMFLMMECQLFSSEPLLFLGVLKAKWLWKELLSLGSHARLHLHPTCFVKWCNGTGVSPASVPQGSVLTWSLWSVFFGAVNTAGAVYFHLIN